MKKGEKRKQELQQIAYEMFLTKGYDQTSVDDIIDKAQIAKGTYYYYFKSKEQMLEEVIEMMLAHEAEKAEMILSQPISPPQKIVAIIDAMRPDSSEAVIENELNRPENIVMHKKIQSKSFKIMIPFLTSAVEQGISEGMFDCDLVPERVKMILSVSSELFDEGKFTENDIVIFIDMTEKLLGAKKAQWILSDHLLSLETVFMAVFAVIVVNTNKEITFETEHIGKLLEIQAEKDERNAEKK